MGITKIQILLINLFCLVFVWVVIYGNSNSYATFEKKTKHATHPINYGLFFIFPLFSQIIEDDFEGNGTIDQWVGDDCNLDSSYANPYVQGLNTSSKVLKYNDIGGQYANVRFDTNQNLDFSLKNAFTFKIYVPSTGLTGKSN